MCSLGTLQSDNGDANEKVTEKLTFRPFKLLRPYTKSPNYLKVGKLDENEERGTHPSSERASEVYRLSRSHVML